MFEFHISRQARQRYQFDQSLFTTSGNVIFGNFLAARQFAQAMNQARGADQHPDVAVQASLINALGLIDELLHQLFRQYRRQHPHAMREALDWLMVHVGAADVEQTLRQFTHEFPPLSVYRQEQTEEEYLNTSSPDPDGVVMPNRLIALEELIMLWAANQNPAFEPFKELFDDARLVELTAYSRVIPSLYAFFATQPSFGPRGENLLDVLLSPARLHPGSLLEQLEFLGSDYVEYLRDVMLRVLSSLDMVREETKPIFPPGPGGETPVIQFTSALYDEPENFSPDLDWMPRLVLMAKNTYVWLDQLSRKYQRDIHTLDQIPQEELDMLRRWGVTGLWLIGLWERSVASQRIKQMRGNTDAVASAYSLMSYDIATDLGGDQAYDVLRRRASRAGIRLASDMVPNHMGIDSRWVIEHPDWFVQLPYSPFPTYTFNGANLSWDERVGIFLEDHYYDSTDAAVVFKRVDQWTGDTRYIYHGNDGTTMPWNDTAQLNYLLPQVREAVIQTILHVARMFPIIRFDAAMTLAKRHFQRLWFPEPGTGGDIASRSEHGLTHQQFEEAFPEEFWRTVVDRVAQEAPDTLLLAEAFWLMEGYFVRTLGMHRVYNSAFMNMMRDERNNEYRLVIKNTMEFDIEIIKRYVNFMNNPDERTAVDQFGKGDKYFGVCTLLTTLPGLPMLGHGQIEGFTEKYGMEFRYPKWHEQPDEDLVARHEREIFPLLRRRYIFADAVNFRLYDFYTPEGFVNEDVFAYSNQGGDERALVVYHNRFADTSGWINTSAAYAIKTGVGDEKVLRQNSLGEMLGLTAGPETFTIFRDMKTGLEYIRSSGELTEQGLYLELNAYQANVFVDWRQVSDEKGEYYRLWKFLDRRGVQSIEEARAELELGEILVPYRELVNPGMFGWLIQNRLEDEHYEPMNYEMALEETERKAAVVIDAIEHFLVNQGDLPAAPPEPTGGTPLEAEEPPLAQKSPAAMVESGAAVKKVGPLKKSARAKEAPVLTPVDALTVRREIVEGVRSLLTLSSLNRDLEKRPPGVRQAIKYLMAGPSEPLALRLGEAGVWGVLLNTQIVIPLGKPGQPVENPSERAGLRFREWILDKIMVQTLTGMGVEAGRASRSALLMQTLLGAPAWLKQPTPDAAAAVLLAYWLDQPQVRTFWHVNRYQGVEWFQKEAFDELVWWTFALAMVQMAGKTLTTVELNRRVRFAYQVALNLLSAEEKSAYRLDKLR